MPIIAWDAAFEAAPADSDIVGQGDDRIRETREQVRLRQQQGGAVMQVSTTVDGRHAVTNGGTHPTGFKVYKSTLTDVCLDFSDTAVTAGTGVNFVGGNVTAGTDPGHKHTGTIVLLVPGTLAVGRVKAVFRAPRALTIKKVTGVVFTAPQGADLRVDVLHMVGPVATTDRNSGGATIFVGANPFVRILNVTPDEFSGFLGDGAALVFKTSSGDATPAIEYGGIVAGDELIISILQVGSTTSGSDLSVAIDVV